jgi:hypothetical protein
VSEGQGEIWKFSELLYLASLTGRVVRAVPTAAARHTGRDQYLELAWPWHARNGRRSGPRCLDFGAGIDKTFVSIYTEPPVSRWCSAGLIRAPDDPPGMRPA